MALASDRKRFWILKVMTQRETHMKVRSKESDLFLFVQIGEGGSDEIDSEGIMHLSATSSKTERRQSPMKAAFTPNFKSL